MGGIISVVADDEIGVIPQRPTILELDEELNMDELSKTLDTMSGGTTWNT